MGSPQASQRASIAIAPTCPELRRPPSRSHQLVDGALWGQRLTDRVRAAWKHPGRSVSSRGRRPSPRRAASAQRRATSRPADWGPQTRRPRPRGRIIAQLAPREAPSGSGGVGECPAASESFALGRLWPAARTATRRPLARVCGNLAARRARPPRRRLIGGQAEARVQKAPQTGPHKWQAAAPLRPARPGGLGRPQLHGNRLGARVAPSGALAAGRSGARVPAARLPLSEALMCTLRAVYCSLSCGAPRRPHALLTGPASQLGGRPNALGPSVGLAS